MKTLNYLLSLFLISSLLLFSCKKDSSLITPQYSQKGSLLISNDKLALNSRVTSSSKILEVTDIDASGTKASQEPPKIDLTKNYVFTLRAQVAPPVYKGNTLQATHVKIIQHYAFVTYNTRGDKYLGGLEIFDVTDISNPTIVWQAVFENTDISSVDYYNNKVYLAGATNPDLGPSYLKSAAILKVLSLDGNYNISKVDTTLDLSSYVGTDVKVTDNAIYATSGSNGYLKIFDLAYKTLDSISLDNARSIGLNNQNVFVFQGQSGRVNVFNKSNNALVTTYNVGGANQAEAKSEIAVSEKYIFTSLNEGGVKILNTDGTLKQSIPKPPTPAGLNNDNYVTNSVSLNGDLVLIANGEAGLYIGGMLETKNDSVAILGRIKFDDGASANFVESRDSVIFVATGTGGLKILSLSIDNGLPPVIIETKVCATLYDTIISKFPEGVNNMASHPNIFSAGATKELVLTKESEVYITFVFDGAGWKNTLGFYTYNVNNPPTSISSIQKQVLFPNVSAKDGGGSLHQGDMVRVGAGKFPAGTVIGFYLVAQGWKNGLLVNGRYTHYTSTQLNIDHHQQHTLFIEKNCGDIVMAWEDIDQEDYISYLDNDFNDLMFTISDNQDPNIASTAFDLTNVAKL